ncbi:MAG: hypothetical protein Q8912_09870 [Bacillota bacterium]|nr:hypothetical protein [Bacillota bacterium]
MKRNLIPKTSSFPQRQHQFQVGERVKTSNHRIGTIVRIDRDELGVFIVAQLDIMSGEFVYDPDDLSIIQ